MTRLTDRARLATHVAGFGQHRDMLDAALQQQPCDPDADPGPVFVMGAPRSGTSVLGWSLNEHPALVCGPESEVFLQQFGFGRLVRAYRASRRRSDGLLAQKDVSLHQYARCLGAGVDRLYRSLLNGQRWVDTTPRHILMARELALLQPKARFVLLLRNGMDVVHSLTHSGFKVWSANSFTLAALTWRTYVTAGLSFAEAHPDRCRTLRYEALREMDQNAWTELLSFLQLEHEPRCRDFLASNVINSSFGGEKAGDRPSIKSWSKLKHRQFELIAGPLMRKLNYEWKSLAET